MSVDDDIFGPIVLTDEVSNAVRKVLGRWLTTYLAWQERRKGLDRRSIPTIRSYKDTGDRIEKFPEDQLPALIAITTGTDQPPSRSGDGVYRGPWQLAVAVVVSAPDPEAVRLITSVYGAAIRACLLQHRTLEGAIEGLDYVSETYDDETIAGAATASRTLGVVRLVFRPDIDGLAQVGMGPPGEPKDDPYEPYDGLIDIESHDVQVDREP